jgi:predicted MPP superfamily phosphohydrolase
MQIKENRTKIYKILTTIIFCFIFISFSILTVVNANYNYEEFSPENYIPTNANVFVDDLGYNSVKINKNRDIKILQLTDLHIGNGVLCVKKDRKAFEDVCALIEFTTPDLIILTGDLVYPMSISSGTNDNLTALKVVAGVIEQYKTPWTMCFGNHDAEFCAKYTKAELCDYLESDELKYCLFERGDSALNGMGNHIINVYNNDSSLNSSLILLDNGEYLRQTQISGYAPVSQLQTDWYSESITELNTYFGKTIQSFVFLHVPLKTYETAWQEYRSGNTNNTTYYYGWANEKGEKISSAENDGTFFDTILNLDSTKGIFCGKII